MLEHLRIGGYHPHFPEIVLIQPLAELPEGELNSAAANLALICLSLYCYPLDAFPILLSELFLPLKLIQMGSLYRFDEFEMWEAVDRADLGVRDYAHAVALDDLIDLFIPLY